MVKNRFIYTFVFLFVVLIVSAQDNVLKNTLIFRLCSEDSISAKKGSLDSGEDLLNELQKEFSISVVPMFGSESSLKSSGVKHELSEMFILELNSKDEYDACFNKLLTTQNVKYVQPYYIPHLCTGENDTYIGSQYAIEITKTLEAFDISNGDTNVVIGIVDTGVDLDHVDLVDNIKINYKDPVNGIDDDLDGFVDNYRGWDIAQNDPNPECTDSTDHGVLVAGISAASTNNGIGIAGVGYKCKFLPVKISNDFGYLVAAYQGIVYAADHGCKIINCSWGDTIPNPALQDVIDYAVKSRGCIVVAAAGNAGDDMPYYPASYDGVVSVGATDSKDVKWSESTFGQELDMCAPGVGILTTRYNNKYSSSWINGTSFAAPMVSGAAALLWAKEPSLTNEQVVERLRISADNIDTVYGNTYYKRRLGYGRLNVLNALNNDSTPSVRIINSEIVSTGIGRYVPGDTISIVITIKNYLSNAKSCLIELVDDSEYTNVIDDFYNAGAINTFETKSNKSYPFKIILHDDIPVDNIVNVSFELQVDGRKDYHQFNLILNPSYVNVAGENIITSFTSNGKVGYSNAGRRIGKGFVFNDVYNLLSSGGIIIGKDKFNIVSSLESSDILIKDVVDTVFSDDCLYGYSSFYPDPDKWNDEIIINQESKIYFNKKYPSSVFHSYVLSNNGNKNIDGVNFGLFIDWDVWDGNYNKAKYDDDLKMIYAYSYSQIIMYAGIVLLSDYDATPYCFDIETGGGGGVDISSDFSDDEMWQALTNSREMSGVSYRSNVATMLSCGSFSISPQELVKIDYILVAANNLQELKDVAINAKIQYAVPVKTNEVNNDFIVYPNPVNDIVTVIGGYDEFSVTIYSSDGVVVYSDENKNKYVINTERYAEGCYFIKLESPTKIVSKKIIITR